MTSCNSNSAQNPVASGNSGASNMPIHTNTSVTARGPIRLRLAFPTRAYAKHGTSVETGLLVVDRGAPGGVCPPVAAVATLADAAGAAARVEAALAPDGKIVDWSYDVWSNSHAMRPGQAGGVNLLAAWDLGTPFAKSPPYV